MTQELYSVVSYVQHGRVLPDVKYSCSLFWYLASFEKVLIASPPQGIEASASHILEKFSPLNYVPSPLISVCVCERDRLDTTCAGASRSQKKALDTLSFEVQAISVGAGN